MNGHFGLEGDVMSYVCEEERMVDTAEVKGQRCYCLTLQRTVSTQLRLMAGYVRTLCTAAPQISV